MPSNIIFILDMNDVNDTCVVRPLRVHRATHTHHAPRPDSARARRNEGGGGGGGREPTINHIDKCSAPLRYERVLIDYEQ